MIITGFENWVPVEELYVSGTNGYSVYFMNTDYPQIGNNTTDVMCNYFPTITYEDMFTKGGLSYAISNSNDMNNNGFYVRVPNTIADNDIDIFKHWLVQSCGNNAIIVEYHLKKYDWTEISLDKYDLITYYGGTKITTTDNVNKISFFCKTFGIQYNNFIPTGAVIDTVTGTKEYLGDSFIYANGQTAYKYNADEVGLFEAIDTYYSDGIIVNNTISLPNQDKTGVGYFTKDMVNYQFYISNPNPKIDYKGYIPVGGIIQWFNKDVVPDGWIYYTGEAISRTEYPELFEVLGTTYGEGDGSTTFNLPNQDSNEEDISQEEIDSIGYGFIMCVKPETVLPIGACLVWYGNYDLPPTGYVQADGSSLNKLDYYDLYKVIGSLYGEETDTEFILPDQNVYGYADSILEEDKLEYFSYIIKAL
jgi:microcystin-dependent protein